MMKANRFLSALLLLISSAGASPAASPSVTDDVARLQGRWQTRVGAKKEVRVALEIRGSQVDATITTKLGLKVKASGAIRVNESTSPRSLDWVGFKTPDGQDVPDLLAIYRLEGDRFTLRSGGFNDERPTDFEPGEGMWADVLVFERPAER
jgi:uncharacterized protein (TIGR03067 family)